MNKTLTTKSFNNRIVILLMILGLSVFFISGCSVSFSTNNNTANTNSAANKTTVSNNANSSTPAPANTNANTTAANSDSSKPEQKANTNVASKSEDSASGEKSDCTVIADNADYFVSATEKTIKLKKGTLVNVVSWDMHQGLYAVNAKIDGKWVRGEINYELIDCPEDGKDAPVKK